jgi:hypothetical protein
MRALFAGFLSAWFGCSPGGPGVAPPAAPAPPPAPAPASTAPADPPRSPPRPAWSIGFCQLAGREQRAYVEAIAFDANGDIVLGGKECASPGINCTRAAVGFVAKVDRSGRVVWFKTPNTPEIVSLDVDPASGDILAAGNLGGSGDAKPFVAKLDAQGNTRWERSFARQPEGWHSLTRALFAARGEAVFTFRWIAPAPATNGSMRWSIDRLSTSGAVLEKRDLPGQVGTVFLDERGAVYTSQALGKRTGEERRAIALTRLDRRGKRSMSREVDLASAEDVILASDAQDNLFVAGRMADARGVVVLKLDASWNERWRGEFRTTATVDHVRMAADPRGRIVVGGAYHGTMSFERALEGSEALSLFLARFDDAGQVWSERIATNRSAHLHALAAGPAGRIVVATDFAASGDEQHTPCPAIVAELSRPDGPSPR